MRANNKPNIVFILTDDQGYWALGCNGNREIKTPNIDKLASEGARFENFFCTSPVCSPARASLLTGRIPSQHGIHDWLREGNMGENSIEYLKGVRAYTEDLVDMGYNCALSGKWHLGDSIHPQKGFTRWYVHQCGGSDYYNAPMIENGLPYNESMYITYSITNHAIGYINEMSQEDKPFYLSVHYTAPHCPWVNNHPKELTDRYKNCKFESCPIEPLHPWAVFSTASNAVRREDVNHPREQCEGYFAAVSGVDDGVGKIVEALKLNNLYDNTIIIFTSDNGYNLGHHGIWGKGNGTFPFNMFETSIKVPFIFWNPSRIKPTVVKHLVSAYDFMPSLLEYISGSKIFDEKKPGRSFVKYMLHPELQKEDNSIVIFDEYGPVRMIRTYDDKYICRYPYGEDEYYDLINDPNESHNLFGDKKYEARILELKQRMEIWFMKYTNPGIDGRLERVVGNGQVNKAGVLSEKLYNYEPCCYEYKIMV